MPPPLSASPIVQSLNRARAAGSARQQTQTQTIASSGTPAVNGDEITAQTPNQVQAAAPARTSGRRAQNVLTKNQKYKIALWMVEQESNDVSKIPSKAVREFPMLFRGAENANISRAMRYWKDRENIVSSYKPNGKMGNDLFMSRATKSGLRRRISKTAAGRGRKRAAWVTELYEDLFEEFCRLRSCSVKFNSNLLLIVAKKLVVDSTTGAYGPNIRDPRSGKLLTDHINSKWVERFMFSKGIVCRVQTGKLSTSAEKKELIEREVAFHLGGLKRGFDDKSLDEECIFNADETHFCINLDDGHTLAMKGDKEVKYSDVVSGDMGMTMMVTLGGGSKPRFEIPMMIFQNDRCSHPIQGVPDTVPGVCYRSGPKGWMDTRVFEEWLDERRILAPLPGEKERVLFVDNASGHKLTSTAIAALRRSCTRLQFLPKNATDLCQPADSFIIQKIKTVWRRMWDQKKLDMITKNEWVDWKKGSGKLTNPGKKFYVKLAAAVVREVENEKDKDGVSYVRKAMMGCGMALNLNGQWEVQQLFPHLQEIVKKYPDNFGGTPVADSLKLDGAVTESE